MPKHMKGNVIASVICLLLSVFALFVFIFVADVSLGWKAILIITALVWIISAISNLMNHTGRQK